MEAVGKFFRYLMKEGWISGGDMADYGARFLRFVTGFFSGNRPRVQAREQLQQAGADRPAAQPVGEHVDSVGKADDLGLMGLMTLFGVSEKPIRAEITDTEIQAFGLFLEELTDGEGAAFLRIIGRGGVVPIVVKVTRDVPEENPGDPPRHITHEYPIKAALPGIAIMRGIAKSIDAAHKRDDAKRRTKAKQLVTMMRKLDVLDNLGDDATAMWSWVTKKSNPLLWHDLNRIANCLGGWAPVRTILATPPGQQHWAAFQKASPEQLAERQQELVDFVAITAQNILRLPARLQRDTWGVKPSRKWFKVAFIVLVWASIFGLIWAMVPTHPV